MIASIDYDWPDHAPSDHAAIRKILADIRKACFGLHDSIHNTYFDYAIEDTPKP